MENLYLKELKIFKDIVIVKDSVISYKELEARQMKEAINQNRALVERSVEDLKESIGKVDELKKQRNISSGVAGALLILLILL